MSNLFYNLHSLLRSGLDNKHEDYFTELFAEVLRDKEAALEFLKQFIELNSDEISELSVATQKSYIKLHHHKLDSKPDMVIEFSSNKKKHVVFFENKIESLEGHKQLRRYADHLQTHLDNGCNVSLVYITKNYDPKNEIAEELRQENIPYIALRWYQVYRWLQQRNNCYTEKVLNYMEGLKMDHSRRFTPNDIIVMQDMKKLFSMMDECMGGQVEEAFTKLYGKQAQSSVRLAQLRNHNRYVSYVYLNLNETARVFWGFSMAEDEYPNLLVFYELEPGYDNKMNELNRIKEFASENEDWVTYGCDDNSRWPGIKIEESIVTILQEDDHVTAIQRLFLEKVEELKMLVPPISRTSN